MPNRRNNRSYDKESGMNRTRRNKPKTAPKPESESEEYNTSDSDLESILDMPAKDDSRRKKDPAPDKATKAPNRDGRSAFIKGEEGSSKALEDKKESETETKIAPHMAILLAATYHVGISSIARPASSSYIPFAGNLFQMLSEMCSLLVDNTLLHEMCPEFFSPVLFLYYGHVYYYHILRARAAAGSDILTRIEKRVLVFYERVGPAEAWPIAAPLIGFFQYFGSHKVEDPMFGWIVPALPDFTQLAAPCLSNLQTLQGGQRIPLIPALQKLVRNFALGTADFDSGLIRPTGDNTLGAANTFCGIQSSATTSAPFQALTWNTTWTAPPETGFDFGIINMTVKRNRINRWKIPDVADDADLSSLQNFLGFLDNASFDWMKHTLSMASIFTRFFPGSSTLAEITPLTTLGSLTNVKYSRTKSPDRVANIWFHPRSGWKFTAHGYTNTAAGLIDTKAALTVAPNAELELITPSTGSSVQSGRKGPFFTDDNDNPNVERKQTIITESTDQADPTLRFSELLTSYYDNKGGRS